MKIEVAKKWVKALRSGKYKQTTGALCEDGKYCCLGVLCEVAIKDGVKIKREELTDGGGDVYQVLFGGSTGTLPDRVAKYAGMSKDKTVETAPFEEVDASLEDQLVTLNDTEKYSFKKIATFIEKNFIKSKQTKSAKKPSSK